MIVFLGISVAVGFGIILPMANNDTLLLDQTIVDKSAPVLLGESNGTTFDGKLSKKEILLQTQVQDFSIPNPKSYKVGGLKVDIEELYSDNENLQNIGITTWRELNKLSADNSGRFLIKYNWNDTPNIDDDYYEVVKE